MRDLAGGEASEAGWTERQRDVLEAALELLVESGDAVTMTAVARRASCSKETLYKWFGDRDGMLTAVVQWQASKVHVAPVDREHLDRQSLKARLEEYAANWLTVIAGRKSVALNRVAMSHAASGRSNLGAIVLEHGRFAMGKRLKPVLEAGRERGLLHFDDAEEAFRVFFGLVARDVQIRLLLGDRFDISAARIALDAGEAANHFIALYGADSPTAGRPRVRNLN